MPRAVGVSPLVLWIGGWCGTRECLDRSWTAWHGRCSTQSNVFCTTLAYRHGPFPVSCLCSLCSQVIVVLFQLIHVAALNDQVKMSTSFYGTTTSLVHLDADRVLAHTSKNLCRSHCREENQCTFTTFGSFWDFSRSRLTVTVDRIMGSKLNTTPWTSTHHHC